MVDPERATLRIESGTDTLLSKDLRRMHRVALHTSRDTVTLAPAGLWFGLANSTIIVSLGTLAETVTVSRLGRARASY